jgi:hypothetical protein
MSGPREFSKEDIPAVADLWLKVFQQREASSPQALQAYFQEMFIDHPWSDAGIPSLVYEDKDRRVVAFLGVLPRLLTFQGSRLQMAVTSQFMVDTTAHRGNAAIELMRKFLAGPQQLSLTDGASEGARRIWAALRGEVATTYSCLWTRVLRPVEYALQLTKNRKSLKPFAAVAKPFGSALDSLLVRAPLTPYPKPVATAIAEEAGVESLLQCVSDLPARWALRPCYSLDSLNWLLRKAGEAKTRGELRKFLVRNPKGEILGWYVYYAKAGGISKVLQICGREHGIFDVIDHLFHDAWQAGSIAVSGRLEPRFARELSQKRCDFIFHDVAVLIHSPQSEIVNAIQRGNAFLTRLDGEWWMRFQEEAWL